ncbi:MAG: SUMF1/EgtB/PvdO family nonheme iron enzyme [Bacteroidales bacterium]|nr:SUMF1/EgtB/PvdO family nonheme iron enzyme [Bacteroidales bacterium]
MKKFMKLRNGLATVVLLLFVLVCHAQKRVDKMVFLDSILSQMIQISDTVYMSKYPVSVDEFMTMIALAEVDTESVLPSFREQIFETKTNAEEKYLLWYAEYESMLHSERKWGENLPIVGLEKRIIYWFLGQLDEMYRRKIQTEDSRFYFRLPFISEWEYAAQIDNNPAGYPLRNKNTSEKMCNYFEVPQTWIHLNARTQRYEIVWPFRNAFSDLLGTETLFRLTERNTFPPNAKGFYDLYGNAAEMMWEENQTRGGSCISTGYDILNSAALASDMFPFLTGFRLVLMISK